MPSTALDLTVIENIWDIIDKKLTNDRSRTVNDRQQITLRIWPEISIKTCGNFVQLILRRLQNCVRVKSKTSSEY